MNSEEIQEMMQGWISRPEYFCCQAGQINYPGTDVIAILTESFAFRRATFWIRNARVAEVLQLKHRYIMLPPMYNTVDCLIMEEVERNYQFALSLMQGCFQSWVEDVGQMGALETSYCWN